jgi:hypothetical protein
LFLIYDNTNIRNNCSLTRFFQEPENWAGALDIAEKDDPGTGITDTRSADWTEPGEDYRVPNK